MPEKQEIPKAKARLGNKVIGGTEIIVDECPYCKGKHFHLGDIHSDGKPRRSDCFQGEYIISLESE